MHFMRMFMDVLRSCRLGVRTLQFLGLSAGGGPASGGRLKYLLTSVHTRDLINAVREAEVPALCILHDVHLLKRVMRPAIASMTARMAHAD
ncbi:MAG: hypothetical protein UY89_C0007G0008 [Parcubacteria group bacterium GW2011_GWA1_54_9]|nr:MAG: hypothetical protein UY89_C0007G0008 [Parcubacteria group bacterium GW2011_GWA1_54_9]